MLSDSDRLKIIIYLNGFRGNESEVKLFLKTGKWSNGYEKAVVEAWLEEREKEKEEQRQKEYVQLMGETNANAAKANNIAFQANEISQRMLGSNNKLLIISIITTFIALVSAGAAWIGANQQKTTAQAQLRPYVLIQVASDTMKRNENGLPFIAYEANSTYAILPYWLRNVGNTPALKIKKQYISYITDSSGEEKLIQSYKEDSDKTDALLPSQDSAIHMDQINIAGFDPSNMQSIRVDLEITYQGFSELDTKVAYSKARLVLIPDKMQGNKIGFYVSQPFLDFGFKDK